MLVLALDSSSETLIVGVHAEGLAVQRTELDGRRHAEAVVPTVEAALAEAGVRKGELDLIAVGRGPGAFTGTRVGLATAKGLALALDIPLLGVGSLWAIARGAFDAGAPGPVAAVIDAHRAEVYAALYDADGSERLAPANLAPEAALAWLTSHAAGELTLQGTGVRRYPETFGALAGPPELDAPKSAVLAREAMRRHQRGAADERATLEPDYVRPSDAIPTAERKKLR